MDERDELLQRITSSGIEDSAAAELLASGGSLADERNTELVHRVVRDIVLDTGMLVPERVDLARQLIFDRVLDVALTDSELISTAADDLDLDSLRAPIVERASELWPAVVNEMSGLESLAARSEAAAAPPPTFAEAGLLGVVRRLRAAIVAAVPWLARILRRADAPDTGTVPLRPPLPDEVDRAVAGVEQGLLERAVLPALRTTLESELGALRSTKLPVREALGLGQLADLRAIIQTTGEQRLARLVTTLTTGCIGVAGPRGSGKTTLLEALTAGVLPSTGSPFRFRVRVAAPTRYDSREFLLHLTNILCRAVLEVIPGPDTSPEARDAWRRRSRLFAVTSALITAGAAGIVLAVLGIDVPAAALAGGAALLGGFWLATMNAPWETASEPPPTGDAGTAMRAQQLLGETRYQLSFSSSTSTSLSVDAKPLSAEVATSSETSRTRLPLSLPEVVLEFREFVESISAPEARTLICIDELDKMASKDDTAKFLNDVKAIFGIANCVFVLSVSEDALASFERRGLPARDAVDSAVDDIVRLEPLDWPGARRLLAERVSRVPTPFWALCYAQTGGLARDLLRFARALFDTAAGKELELGDAARTLADIDMANRCHGTMAALADTNRGAAIDEPAMWLHELPPEADALQLQFWLSQAPLAALRANEKSARAAQLVAQFVTYAYLEATVREVFATGRAYAELEQGEAPDSPRSFDHFGDIRRLLAVSPRAAWRSIDTYRASWQLPTWPSQV